MKFVLTGLGNWYAGWDLIKKAVPHAEELGYWAVVLPDHYIWRVEADLPPDVNPYSTLDTWTTLAYLAAKTGRIRLGTLVTPLPRYVPNVLAKVVSTLDVLSGGRAVLGVGAGSSRRDFEGFSEWSEPSVRVDKTEEALNLILRLWKEDTVNFQGKYYKAVGALLEPKPVQNPHPPLLFGGTGRRMLRMAGRYADICLIPPWTEVGQAEARAVVLKEAARCGRKSKLSFAVLDVSPKYELNEHTDRVDEASKSGCDYFTVGFWRIGGGETFLASMEAFAKDIIPSFGD